jgi:Ca-activated chloride channel family protein
MPSASTCPEGRRRLRLTPAGVITIALAVWVVQTAAQPRFRGHTDLVALQVTVVDQQHRVVPDLGVDDFRVFEDGQPQTVSLFAAGTAPLDLMLLLDTSGSMVGILEIARRAAVSFARGLGPDDRAGVILINQRVGVGQQLTNDAVALERAIEEAPIAGETALWDAMYIALKEFTRGGADARMRRQALIVFTDGEDTASHVSVEDVLALARATSVVIYTIVPKREPAASRRNALPRVLFDMRRLADESGGRAFTPAGIADLTGAVDAITRELGQQYWLAYAPTTVARGFRRINVRIEDRPLLRARTRSGYYSGPQPSSSLTYGPRVPK